MSPVFPVNVRVILSGLIPSISSLSSHVFLTVTFVFTDLFVNAAVVLPSLIAPVSPRLVVVKPSTGVSSTVYSTVVGRPSADALSPP